MVVEVSTVHEVEDEAELVLGVEGVCHADYEGAVVASADQAQHDPLVQSQSLTLLHLNALLVKTLKYQELGLSQSPSAQWVEFSYRESSYGGREGVYIGVYC